MSTESSNDHASLFVVVEVPTGARYEVTGLQLEMTGVNRLSRILLRLLQCRCELRLLKRDKQVGTCQLADPDQPIEVRFPCVIPPKNSRNRAVWSDCEDDRLWEQRDAGAAELARRHGRSESAVEARLDKLKADRQAPAA